MLLLLLPVKLLLVVLLLSLLLALLLIITLLQCRAAAATTVWIMMIAGFAITAGSAGALLDPYSPGRLIAVTAGVSMLAVLLTLAAQGGTRIDANVDEKNLRLLKPGMPAKAA